MEKLLLRFVLLNSLTLLTPFVLLAQTSYIPPAGRDSVKIDTAENTWRITTETDFTNSYLWRGIVYNHGAVFQPSADIYYKGLELNVWSNFSLYENEEHSIFHELDFTMSYEKELGNFYVQPSLLFYTYPPYEKQSVTGEASLFLGYYLGNIGIYTNPNYDFILNPGGFYIENGINYDNETDKYHIQCYLAHGIGNNLFTAYNVGMPEEGKPIPVYQLVKFDGSFRYNFKSGLYLRPHLTFNGLLNNEVNNFFNKDAFSIGLASGFQF